MSTALLAPGHVILAVRTTAERGETREAFEQRIVDWLGAALDVEPSRRSTLGEWVVGPANPVTVLPLLDLDEQALADREARLCQGRAEAHLGTLPSGTSAGALVHLDWAGAETALETRWTDGLLGWAPTEGTAIPDVAVVASCFDPERTRPPIEPPGLLDDIDLPDIKPPELLSNPLTWVGVAALAVIGIALWQGSRSGRNRI
jgi:hypothetical protein